MSQATTTIDEIGTTRGRVARMKLAVFIQRQGALIALVLVCIFAAYRYDRFLTEFNLSNVLRQNSMLGLVALGMTFVILTGGIDLSVGSFVAVAGVIAANLAGRGTLTAVVVAVGFTTLLGLVNGLVIAKARIQPFIATLAMMIAARGLALVYTGEQSVKAESVSGSFSWLGRGAVGPVPVPVLILIVAYAIAWIVLNHTRFGRHVYSVGDNEEASRLMGLNVSRVTIGVYALSGGAFRTGRCDSGITSGDRTTGSRHRLGVGRYRRRGRRRDTADRGDKAVSDRRWSESCCSELFLVSSIWRERLVPGGNWYYAGSFSFS